MNRKFSFLFVLVFTIFSPASLFPAEEIKLISYYPAPFGAYKELKVGSGDDYIKIYDNNGPSFANGSEITSSDNLVRIKGMLNVYAESGGIHQIKVGKAVKYNLVEYNPGGSGMTIADRSISGPVVIDQQLGLPIVNADTAVNINVKQMVNNCAGNESITKGLTVQHFLDSSATTYGIYVWGNNTGGGQFYGGYFNGKLATTGSQSGAIKHLYDVAELIPCGKGVEYGDIVVVNSEKSREVIKCTTENQLVIGIISENPQISCGDREEAREKEPGKNWNFIALAGQVYCKVDAAYGEIRPGDLLTTSPTPGHAMKAQPVNIGGIEIYRPGTIVGKALEPLKEGRGKILVFVSGM